MKKKPRDLKVVTLAYAHHYIYLLLIVFVPLLIGGDNLFLSMGLGFLLYAAYSLIGYKLHWKHIYCSFSIPRRAPRGWKMKTNHYNWKSISKVDVYAVVIMCGLFGAACLMGHFGMFDQA
jgi:hypothetical protein